MARKLKDADKEEKETLDGSHDTAHTARSTPASGPICTTGTMATTTTAGIIHRWRTVQKLKC